MGIGAALAEELEEHLQGRSGILFSSRSDGYLDPNGLRRYIWDKALAKSNLHLACQRPQVAQPATPVVKPGPKASSFVRVAPRR